MDYAAIRGFNYQPNWGTSGLEIWRRFDARRYAQEIALAKRHFPKINTLRIWLSHDAWMRDEKRFETDFDATLGILAKHGLVAIPTLFNRWHDGILDYGGIYLDHFVPGISWLQCGRRLAAFTEAVVGPHAADPRVLAWDLCNEPFWGNPEQNDADAFFRAEYAWLKDMRDAAKGAGACAPLTIGLTTATPFDAMAPLCDLLTFHPYWTGNPDLSDEKARYERLLDEAIASAARLGKPLLATECCWGALDDARRVEIIRYSLEQINRRRIGWLAYVLHTSDVIDCHGPERGPVSNPGNLAFIRSDGTVRPGHEIINEFM